MAGEDRILVPGFPMAWAVDELDWNAGTLRRRLRVPMLDWARLTPEERLAFHDPKFDGPWEPRERGTAELRYPFQVERAELVAILNAVPGPLSDAAGISIRDFDAPSQPRRSAWGRGRRAYHAHRRCGTRFRFGRASDA